MKRSETLGVGNTFRVLLPKSDGEPCAASAGSLPVANSTTTKGRCSG